MTADSPAAPGKELMPVAWYRTYTRPSGKSGRVFTTTMGASQDFAHEATRRMILNACFWAVGLEDKIPDKSKVDIVGKFEASSFRNNGFKKGVKPSDLQLDSIGDKGDRR